MWTVNHKHIIDISPNLTRWLDACVGEIIDLLRQLAATDKAQAAQLDRIEELLKRLQHPQITGGRIVIIVKDDHPEVKYAISGVTAVDAEGHPVPDTELVFDVTSTDDTVLDIVPDDPPTTGVCSFDSPGIASVNVQVSSKSGTLLGSFGQQFTVTVGDPAAISGGSITFEGLTDTP